MNYDIEDLRAIVDLAKRKRFDDLEEKWLELAEDPPDEMRFYDSMVRALLKNNATDKVGELFPLMVSALLENGRPAEALEVARIVWRYAPDTADLRDPALDALKVLHGDRPNFERFVAAAGLDRRGDLFRALERFEELLYCDEGEVFEHKTFGIGIVEEIEPERRRVYIRFAGKAPKEFTFDGVREFLTKLERNGFRAERLRDPEALKRRALESPAEFVRFVLKDYPEGLSQIGLKNLLLEGLFSPDEWSRWWAANRNAIRRDPYIDGGRGPRDPMRLRAEPKGYYDAVAEEFAETDSTLERLRLVAEVGKHLGEEPAPENFATRLVESLRSELAVLDEGDIAGRLERTYIAQEIARLFEGLALPAEFDDKALLGQTPDPARTILAVSPQEIQCRAVETLFETDPDNAEAIAARMIPDAQPRFAQWLIEKLIERGALERAATSVEQVLRSPSRNPATFIWAARQFFAGKFAALAIETAPHEVVRDLATQIKELQNRVDHRVPEASALRGVVTKLKNLLAENRFAILRDAIAPLETEQARAICRLFESHAAFPDHYLSALKQAVIEARPDLEEKAQGAGGDELDGTVLFVSEESLKRKRRELQHLRTVEIPKNSREIGEAASLGDLSENAEYEAARNRQRLLFQRAEELQKEIERARIIRPSDVRTDCVWVGTRFEAKNLETGEIESYTILGAWDGRPEENVLSYLTPAAAQFLKKRVGDRIRVKRPNGEPTEYEIVRIENAIA